MRLRDKDKKWLAELVGNAVKDAVAEVVPGLVDSAVWEALTVDLTWEKVKDEETGIPLATKEVISEKVFLPTFFCQHLKFHEGAYRGNQETLDKVKNNSNAAAKKLEILGQAFSALEDPMIVLERFVGLLAKTGIMNRLEDLSPVDVIGSEVKKIGPGGQNARDDR